MSSTGTTRRERQRQATFDEIVEASRRLLREPEEVSLRAVATEMGLTAPALYRYVDSHAELMLLMARSIFEDVVAAMTVARDAHPEDDPAAQMVASTAAFRQWALNNRREFQHVFATTSPELDEMCRKSAMQPISSLAEVTPAESGAQLFAVFFTEIFGRLWEKYRFPIPADEDLDPDVVAVLREQFTAPDGPDFLRQPTPGMLWLFERQWCRVYGTVTLEVFEHMHPAFIDSGAMFEASMRDVSRDLGLEDEWERLAEISRAR